MAIDLTLDYLIKLEKITKIYKVGKIEVVALKDVSFEIEPCEFVTIMGPSGSGKSTLMHILGCLMRPTYGEYYLLGKRINDLQDDELALIRNQWLGFVFQLFNLLPIMNVEHNVELPMLYAGISREQRRKRAIELLSQVGLKERIKHYPNELSGGEQQRVAIARALANDPVIVLADEPTGNLDSKTGKEIMQMFKNLNEQGKTIILVTHDKEVAEFGKRLIEIKDGKIVSDKKKSPKIYVSDRKFELKKKRSFIASFLTGFLSGIRAILHNRLRSLLTVLGIVIGVSAVIGMLSVGEGARRKITGEIEKLGANVLVVYRRRAPSKEKAEEWRGRSEGLTYEDAIKISKYKYVEAVAPEIRKGVIVRYRDREYEAQLIGTTPEYQKIRNHKPEFGRFITDEDLKYWRKICVIGKNIKDELFKNENPLLKEIKIDGKRFVIVGVMEEKGAFGPLKFDDRVFVPLITIQKRFTGSDNVDLILVKTEAGKTDSVRDGLYDLLLKLHNNVEDFGIASQEEFRETMEQTLNTFKILLASIAAISLLVGGIGIMNIMLVAVTERTREIGLRKAVGARRKDILIQFLIESVILSLTGGIIGILLGIIFANTVGNIMVGATTFGPRRLFGTGGQSIITFSSILLSFLFALFVGIFFGLYPAWKAAKRDPVEALRYE